jgi:hypothetical protein
MPIRSFALQINEKLAHTVIEPKETLGHILIDTLQKGIIAVVQKIGSCLFVMRWLDYLIDKLFVGTVIVICSKLEFHNYRG